MHLRAPEMADQSFQHLAPSSKSPELAKDRRRLSGHALLNGA